MPRDSSTRETRQTEIRCFPAGAGIFLFATVVSRPALEPTQPPIQLVPRVHPSGVKQPGPEADHSPPYSANVKNVQRYTSTHPYSMPWYLVKHRGNFTFMKWLGHWMSSVKWPSSREWERVIGSSPQTYCRYEGTEKPRTRAGMRKVKR